MPNYKMKSLRTFSTGLAVIGLGAALLTGCGSSDSTSGSAGSQHGLTGSPLVVGFPTTGSGSFANPEMQRGAEVAVDHINANGGINGHPLKLKVCSTDGTPATSVQCANKFVTEKVSIVLNGFDAGIDAALPVLKQAGIVLAGEFGGAATYADTDAVVFAPPVPVVFQLMTHVLKQENTKKLVVMLPAGPFVKQIFDATKPIVAQAGIKATMTTTAAASPDYTAAFTAAMSSGADAVFLNYPESGCTDAIRAARTVGFKGVIFSGDCQQFRKALGAQADGVYSLSILYPYDAMASIADPNTKAQLKTYHAAMSKAGFSKDLESYAQFGFSTVMTFADIAKSVKAPFTPKTVGQAVSTFQGSVFMGDKVDCRQRPMPGAACSNGMAILQADAKGGVAVVSGEFMTLANIK